MSLFLALLAVYVFALGLGQLVRQVGRVVGRVMQFAAERG